MAKRTIAEKMAKRGRGAPSVYKPEFCDTAMAILEAGGSLTAVAAACDVGKSTVYDWIDSESPYFNEEFSETVKKGITKAEAWWERLGQEAAAGKREKVSAPIWIFNMKNKFGWKDKSELTGEDGAPVFSVTVSAPTGDE